MKKFLKSRLAAWLLAVAFVGAAQLSLPENEFIKAQRQTVLIENDGGSGSGVVIRRENKDGKVRLFIWTADHVMRGYDTAKVRQYIRHEGRRAGFVEYTAKVIGRSPAKDCALLWLNAPGDAFGAAEFDSLTPPVVGSEMLHVGNVLGKDFDGSVSVGVLSQVAVAPERVQGWPWGVVDQITCQALFGGSGGPVFKRSNQKVAGLLVGGLVGSGYITYTPVREIYDYAKKNGLFWAVYGDFAPSDVLLEALATASKTPPPPPAVTVELKKKR